MAIHSADELATERPMIDLTGPDGNAFVVMKYAMKFGRDLSFDQEKIDGIIEDMKSSDYEHLIDVFEEHFGDFVDLYR